MPLRAQPGLRGCVQERKNHNWAIGGDRWGIRINPVSFFGSVILIWGFAVRPPLAACHRLARATAAPHENTRRAVQIWCMVKTDAAKTELADVQRWVADTMTWIYMLTQQVWIVFLLVLYVSKLGKLKLGKPTDEPEYPTVRPPHSFPGAL